MADFHSKMSVCRHELGEGGQPSPPPTIPTLSNVPGHSSRVCLFKPRLRCIWAVKRQHATQQSADDDPQYSLAHLVTFSL